MSRQYRRGRSLLETLNPFSRRVDRALEWKRSRRLQVEALEDRRVLAVTWNIIPIAAGTVVGNGVDNMAGNADDEITIAVPTEALEAFNEATRLFDQYLTDDITVNL